MKFHNDLFLRAARGESTPRPPIWLMRQAGRTDPEYNKLKDESGMTLDELFRHPEMAARISLLPKRLGVDAIIFFQDILTPLTPMGAPFVFAPGPSLVTPIRTPAQALALEPFDVREKMGFIAETFGLLHEALEGELPVLGFCGAPMTLAVFLIEGGSFGREAPASLEFFRRFPDAAHELLGRLTDQMIAYLTLQAECGAAAVQVFESAAHVTPPALYREFALPYQQRIVSALRGLIPTIIFAHEQRDLGLLKAAGADIISLPSGVTIAEARAALGANQTVQGNLDNRLLVTASLDEITCAARACIESGQCRGHIFNLSHGLLRETPYESVQHLVQTVTSWA